MEICQNLQSSELLEVETCGIAGYSTGLRSLLG